MDVIPIVDLDVTQVPKSDTSIDAVVVLMWPFASSTGTSAFLLAEQDFRLRRAGGQIRWELVGHFASLLASSGIQIGDTVRLQLDGATWVDNPKDQKLPGRCIERTLQFSRRLGVKVTRDDTVITTINTNIPEERHYEALEPKSVEAPIPHYNAWSSPAFLRKRADMSYSSSPYALPSEDEEFPEDRARKRSKFWRKSGEWTFSQDIPDLSSRQLDWDESILDEEQGLAASTEAPYKKASTSTLQNASYASSPSSDLASHRTPGIMPLADWDTILGSSVAAADAIVMAHPSTPVLSTSTPLPLTVSHSEAKASLTSTSISTLTLLPEPGLHPVALPGSTLASPSKVDNWSTAESDRSVKVKNSLSQEERVTLTQFGLDGTNSPGLPLADVHADSHSQARVVLNDTTPLNDLSSVSLRTTPEVMLQGIVQTQVATPTLPITDDESSGRVVKVLESGGVKSDGKSHAGNRPTPMNTEPIDGLEYIAVSGIDLLPSDPEILMSRSPTHEVEQGITGGNAAVQWQETTTDTDARLADITIKTDEHKGGIEDEASAVRSQPSDAEPEVPDEAGLGLNMPMPLIDRLDDAAGEVIDMSSPVSLPDLSFSSEQPSSKPQHTGLPTVPHKERSPSLLPQDEPLSVTKENDPAGHNLPVEEFPLKVEEPTPSNEPQVRDARQTSAVEQPTKSNTIRPKLENDNMLPGAEAILEQVSMSAQAKARKKKRSAKKRQSVVPNIISPWFTARQQRVSSDPESEVEGDLQRPTDNNIFGLLEVEVSDATKLNGSKKRTLSETDNLLPTNPEGKTQEGDAEPLKTLVKQPSKHDLFSKDVEKLTGGFRTTLSYYSPLSGLEQHVNKVSTDGSHVLDLFAVVILGSAPPSQAKAGAKDWSTVMRITDPSITGSSVRVQVFRHYKNALPEAATGDTILLRNFVVKSRKRQSFLLSMETSAWLVWRTSGHDTRQECKGPPVEVGVEEQEYALKLKKWRKTSEHVKNE